jgi:Glycosyltransferase family 87
VKQIPYYLQALAMAIPAALIGFGMPSWLSLSSPAFALKSDVRVVYTPAYMLRTGQRKAIYNFSEFRRNQSERVARDDDAQPFLHPAYEAAIFVPLSFLPYRAAYLTWTGVNFVVVALIYTLLRPFLTGLLDLGLRWMPLALLIGFLPIALTIIEGQDSLFLLLVLVMAYRRIGSNDAEAGLLLSLGVFRFQVLLPIVALFLLWRRWRFVAGWFAGSAALAAISAAITGIGAQIQYVKLLQASRVSFWLLLGRMPNLRALFAACDLGIVPLAVTSVLVFLIALFVGNRQDSQQKLLLAVSVSAIVPWYLFMHDVSVLALPLLLAISQSVGQGQWMRALKPLLVLTGFASFWFAQHSFYLGVLLTLFFFGLQVADSRRPLIARSELTG